MRKSRLSFFSSAARSGESSARKSAAKREARMARCYRARSAAQAPRTMRGATAPDPAQLRPLQRLILLSEPTLARFVGKWGCPAQPRFGGFWIGALPLAKDVADRVVALV